MIKFIIENIYYIISIATTFISLIVAIITYLKTKNKTRFKEAIKDTVVGYIEEAEKFKHYTGAEKKAFVMTKIMSLTKVFKESELSIMIDELVEFTNKVNTKTTKKG